MDKQKQNKTKNLYSTLFLIWWFCWPHSAVLWFANNQDFLHLPFDFETDFLGMIHLKSPRAQAALTGETLRSALRSRIVGLMDTYCITFASKWVCVCSDLMDGLHLVLKFRHACYQSWTFALLPTRSCSLAALQSVAVQQPGMHEVELDVVIPFSGDIDRWKVHITYKSSFVDIKLQLTETTGEWRVFFNNRKHDSHFSSAGELIK